MTGQLSDTVSELSDWTLGQTTPFLEGCLSGVLSGRSKET
jgi:hypothetical protein